MDTAYWGRIAALAVTNPPEFVARMRGQIEVRVDALRPPQTVRPTGDWWRELHNLLGSASTSCDRCAGFEDIWEGLKGELVGTRHEAGRRYDGGIGLARGAFAATRHLRPDVVLETGVARGITSRIILEALEINGEGRLISIDLPPLNDWRDEAAIAVPEQKRERWTLLCGTSRQLLPKVLRKTGPVPLFVHDSLHTTGNMLFEFDLAWRNLRSGGLMLADDIEDSSAFAKFVSRRDVTAWVASKEPERSGHIGAVRR